MKTSIIIATMNRPEDLRRALESILKQSLLPDEVLLVDQSVDDRTRRLADELKAKYPDHSGRLKYFFQQEKSLVKARNRGIDESVGELILFLDDDIALLDDYLEQVVKYLSANPSVGALSGNVLLDKQYTGWKGRLLKIIKRLFLINSFDGRMTASGFGYPIYDRCIDRLITVEMLTGCNMVFRRVFLERERCDEWFTGYSNREDVDLSYRISRLTKMVMIPEAKLYHYCSPAARISSVEKKRMEMRNYHYLFKKFKKRGLWSQLLFAYSVFGLLVIDFLEFAIHPERERYQVFVTSLRAVLSMPRIDKK